MLGVLHYNKWLIKKKSINHNLARYEVTSDKALNNCQKFQFGIKFLVISVSAAASGWAGWALAHPELGGSVSPITTRGKIMPTSLLLAHPDLKSQRHLCMGYVYFELYSMYKGCFTTL